MMLYYNSTFVQVPTNVYLTKQSRNTYVLRRCIQRTYWISIEKFVARQIKWAPPIIVAHVCCFTPRKMRFVLNVSSWKRQGNVAWQRGRHPQRGSSHNPFPESWPSICVCDNEWTNTAISVSASLTRAEHAKMMFRLPNSAHTWHNTYGSFGRIFKVFHAFNFVLRCCVVSILVHFRF